MKKFLKNNILCIVICTILSLILSLFLAKTFDNDYQLAILNDNGTHYLSMGTKNDIKIELSKDGNKYFTDLDKKTYGIKAHIEYENLEQIKVNDELVKSYTPQTIYGNTYEQITMFNINKQDKKTNIIELILFLIFEILFIYIFKNQNYKSIFNKKILTTINKKHIIITFIIVCLTLLFVTGGDAAVIINTSNMFSEGIDIYQFQVNSRNLLGTVYAEFPYNPISLFIYGGIFKLLHPIMKTLPLLFNYTYLHIFLIKIINWFFINFTIIAVINYFDKYLNLTEKKKTLIYYLSFLNPITFYVAFIFVQIDALSLFLFTLGFLNLPKLKENNYTGIFLLSIASIIKMQLFILIPIIIISTIIYIINKKNIGNVFVKLTKTALIFVIIALIFLGLHFVLKTPYYLITTTLKQSERIFYTTLHYMGDTNLLISVLLIGLALYNYAFKLKSNIKEFSLVKINLIYMLVMIFMLSASIVPTPSIYILSLPAFIAIIAEEKDWYRIFIIYIMSIFIVLLPMLSDYGDITLLLSLNRSNSLLMNFLQTLNNVNFIKFYNIVFSISCVSMLAYSLLAIKKVNSILDDSNSFEENLSKETKIKQKKTNTIDKIIKIYKKYEEVLNYLIIGFLTTLVNLITKYLLLFTILDAKNAKELQLSIIISWIVAVIFAYITNRKIVFKSKSNNFISEFIKFIEARVATLIVEMVYMWIFVTALKLNTELWVLFWTASCQLLIIILNYIFSKLFVFKKR